MVDIEGLNVIKFENGFKNKDGTLCIRWKEEPVNNDRVMLIQIGIASYGSR